MWAGVDKPVPTLIDNEGMWFNVRNASVSARTCHWELWEQLKNCIETNSYKINERYLEVRVEESDERV